MFLRRLFFIKDRKITNLTRHRAESSTPFHLFSEQTAFFTKSKDRVNVTTLSTHEIKSSNRITPPPKTKSSATNVVKVTFFIRDLINTIDQTNDAHLQKLKIHLQETLNNLDENNVEYRAIFIMELLRQTQKIRFAAFTKADNYERTVCFARETKDSLAIEYFKNDPIQLFLLSAKITDYVSADQILNYSEVDKVAEGKVNSKKC